MTKHTPGPWSISEHHKKKPKNYEHGTYCKIIANGFSLATVDGPSNSGREMESVNNARLIAAAPELLAACREILIHCQLLGSGQESALSNAEMCEMIGSAIAKAEGDEPAEPCIVCGAPVRHGHAEEHDEGCMLGDEGRS